MPGTSIRRPRAPCDSGISVATAIRASTATGTLIRKTDPHQNLSSSQPPSSGPTGKPRNVAPITTAMARGRSSSVNRTGITAMDIGRITAAPSPRMARAAISSPAEVAKAHASGADAEHGQGDQQHPLAAQPVAEHPGRQQRRRQHQAVGGREPLQVGGGGMQLHGQRRQRQAQHGQVQARRRARSPRWPPAPTTGGPRRCSWRHHPGEVLICDLIRKLLSVLSFCQ